MSELKLQPPKRQDFIYALGRHFLTHRALAKQGYGVPAHSAGRAPAKRSDRIGDASTPSRRISCVRARWGPRTATPAHISARKHVQTEGFLVTCGDADR